MHDGKDAQERTNRAGTQARGKSHKRAHKQEDTEREITTRANTLEGAQATGHTSTRAYKQKGARTKGHTGTSAHEHENTQA